MFLLCHGDGSELAAARLGSTGATGTRSSHFRHGSGVAAERITEHVKQHKNTKKIFFS